MKKKFGILLLMRKIFFILNLAVVCVVLHAGENAVSASNVIPRAYFYVNIQGGVTHGVDRGGDYVRVTPDSSFFFDSNNTYLKKRINYEKWSPEQQKILDAMIDPKAEGFKPTFIGIGFDACWVPMGFRAGRAIFYLDDAKNVKKSDFYEGPVDVKGAQDYPFLLKPHSLLSNVKEVREQGYFLWNFPYLKRVITYHDDGIKTDIITDQHRRARNAERALAVAAVGITAYSAYKLIAK